MPAPPSARKQMPPTPTDPVVIVAQARTPIGCFQGALAALSASQLGAQAIKAALERSGLPPEAIQEVIMGNVLSAGQGQAPTRQAALAAGLPLSANCTGVNKMCASGMKAVMLAHDMIACGSNDIMLAGGMESMSNAPFLLPDARRGMRLGHRRVLDHLFFDGLEDAYDKGKLMGDFAELCADKYAFTRQQQDAFALTSLQRANRAHENGCFDAEITPIDCAGRHGPVRAARDEQPPKADLDSIPRLRPAFKPDGSVTAANASSISDGAAALILMRQSQAQKHGLTPLARILAHATYAHQPAWFTTAPIGAIEALLHKLDWRVSDVDLFEINEAFAVVTMAAMQTLELAHEKVNVHGGACALGHPIGASGARIIVTLLNALQHYRLHTGIAALCIGGGEATALAIQRD